MNLQHLREQATITLLIGLYIACELIANITASKPVTLGNIVVPAVIFIYTLMFGIKCHKRWPSNSEKTFRTSLRPIIRQGVSHVQDQ